MINALLNQDAILLQKDLDKLAEWETKWQMEFHPQKCQVLRITRKAKPITANYDLLGHQLELVKSAKYLGVTIQSNLNWNIHINDITSKGNNTLSFLRRNLKINSVPLKECAYKTLVRPLVEYSSTVWDPYTQNNIWNLEMVQRRSARYVLNQYHTTASVTTMINQLNWESLQRRRENARLNMFYKAHHGLAAIQLENYLVPIYAINSFFEKFIRKSISDPPFKCRLSSLLILSQDSACLEQSTFRHHLCANTANIQIKTSPTSKLIVSDLPVYMLTLYNYTWII